MAFSLEAARNAVITNLFGRRLGLDTGEFLAGVKDVRRVVTDLTSASTATAIPNHGFVNVTATSLATSGAGGTFVLSNPVPGVSVTVFNVNAATSAASPGSTAMFFIRPSTAFVIYSTEGTTETTIQAVPGGSFTLTGVTTGVYALTSRTFTSAVLVNGTT